MLSLRTLTPIARPAASTLRSATLSHVRQPLRSFQTTAVRKDTVVAPARRPVGAFRGGLFGFLFGSVLAGAGMYYYILDEYRISNELLTEDIFALQAAVHRIEDYTKSLESQVADMQKKKGL